MLDRRKWSALAACPVFHALDLAIARAAVEPPMAQVIEDARLCRVQSGAVAAAGGSGPRQPRGYSPANS